MVGSGAMMVRPVNHLEPSVKKLAFLMLLLALAGTAAACSSDDETPSAQDAVSPTVPSSTGDQCEDPASDLTNDATAVGVGTEPAGIDLTAAAAELQDDGSVQFTFTTVGPIEQSPGTTFAVAQGTPYTALAFEVRATADGAGAWAVEVITWDDAELKTAVPVSPMVSGNMMTVTVPQIESLPPLGLYLQFGASADLAGVGRVLDDCSSLGTAPTVG